MTSFLNICDMILKGKSVNKSLVVSLEAYSGDEFITSSISLANFTEELSGVGYDEVEVLIKDKLAKIQSETKVNTIDDLLNMVTSIKHYIDVNKSVLNQSRGCLTDSLEKYINDEEFNKIMDADNNLIYIKDIELNAFLREYITIVNDEKLLNGFETLFNYKPGEELNLISLKFLKYIFQNSNAFWEDMKDIPFTELNEEFTVGDLHLVLINRDSIIPILTNMSEYISKFIWDNQPNDKITLERMINYFKNINNLLNEIINNVVKEI